MIVIASHNGGDHLRQLIDGMSFFGTKGEDVLIVDNQTTDLYSLGYMEHLQESDLPFKVYIDKTNFTTGYEPGAFIWSFRNYEDDRYVFFQDSMRVTGPDWLTQFDDRHKEGADVVPWAIFRPLMFGMHPDNVLHVIEGWGQDLWHKYRDNLDGFFGSIFSVKREALLKADEAGLFPDKGIPTSKWGAQAMERVFPIVFAEIGASVTPIIGMETKEGWPLHQIVNNLHLRKVFGGRN